MAFCISIIFVTALLALAAATGDKAPKKKDTQLAVTETTAAAGTASSPAAGTAAPPDAPNRRFGSLRSKVGSLRGKKRTEPKGSPKDGDSSDDESLRLKFSRKKLELYERVESHLDEESLAHLYINGRKLDQMGDVIEKMEKQEERRKSKRRPSTAGASRRTGTVKRSGTGAGQTRTQQ